MNEYTRREEVRWTLVAAGVLVLCISGAILRLMTTEGKMVPDPSAQAAAATAATRVAQAQGCVVAAEKLNAEITLFQGAAKTARVDAEDPADAGPPRRRSRPKVREKEPDVGLAWASAQPSYKHAKAVGPCREAIESALGGPREDTTRGWEAILAASLVAPPQDGDKTAHGDATRKLLQLLGEAPVARVLEMTRDGHAALQRTADAEAQRAASTLIREPLPRGLLPREIVIIVGVGLCLAALLVSFLSVRAASSRRAAALLPLRRGAAPGIQAATILRLAAQHNGGEPGLVAGAATGGLAAALARPADGDLFVLGVMAGLVLGLAAQWGLRLLGRADRWRARAIELGDIEKPQIPIVLVLGGVNAGLERQFMAFFSGLSPADAAATVEKLAAKAEDKILLAAEGAAARGGAGPAPGR